ncbi:hypothetical protein [Prosthecobacter fusiformis]|uniref:hypothetical protein n=1 Tax=Prosthecobacter fusiformis TaxID=48464 RepID=UPI00105EE49C|nr:hypothetical protein [Prosthecobacter fusiformis]
MSTEIIVAWENSHETAFPTSKSVFNLVCDSVGESADRLGHQEVGKLCKWAKQDGNLLLVDATSEAKAVFRDLLREALNDGTIIKEILSWPTPHFDASTLLPENRTPEVISFICNAAAIGTLRRLTFYLDRV